MITITGEGKEGRRGEEEEERRGGEERRRRGKGGEEERRRGGEGKEGGLIYFVVYLYHPLFGVFPQVNKVGLNRRGGIVVRGLGGD
jgi:hypothetical protein